MFLRTFFLVLFAVLTVGCAENLAQMDRALASAAGSVSTIDRVTGKRVINLENRAQQITKADREAVGIIGDFRKEGVLLNEAADSYQYSRLVKVFKKVHAVTHLRNEKWTPVLVGGEDLNAFVNGGTHMFIFLGMMKDLANDGELAVVIAHEIAHVAANHRFEQAAHTQIGKLTGSKSVKRKHFQIAFGHEQEEEADKIGVLYIALAGYDPNFATRVWEKFYKAEGDSAALMQSHPVNSARLRATREVAAKVRNYYYPGYQNARFAEILEDNTLWRKSEKTLEAGKGGGLIALAETIANAKIQHEQAKAEEQRQQAEARRRDEIARQKDALVAAAARLTRINQMQVISPDSLKVSFTWRGNIPIGNIKMRATLPGGQHAENETGGPLLSGLSYFVVLRFNGSPFAYQPIGAEIPLWQIGSGIKIGFIDAKPF